MAQPGEVGAFLPAESHYRRPGTYEKMLQAESSKRAVWLANMDQFFAQLEEAQRQFNVTAAFKEKTFAAEHALAQERLKLEGRRVDLEGERVDVAREGIAAQKDYWQGLIRAQEGQTNLLSKEYSDRRFWDIHTGRVLGDGQGRGTQGAFGVLGDTTGAGNITPGQEEFAQFFAGNPSKAGAEPMTAEDRQGYLDYLDEGPSRMRWVPPGEEARDERFR